MNVILFWIKLVGIKEAYAPMEEDLEKFGESIFDLVDNLKKGWNDFWDSWKVGEEALEEFGGKVYDFVDSVKTDVDDFCDTWETGEKALEHFGENLYDFVESATQWGKDLIDNFIGGVKEKWNDWEGTWEGVGEVIYDLLHHTKPERGLLANDDTWMPDMMQSFSEGIKQNIPMVTAQAETLKKNLHDILDEPISADVDFPEPENAKIKIEVPDLPEIENPELSLNMPSIDVPELAFNMPELPDFRLPKLTPEAWEAFRIQSMRTPAVSAPDAGSEIINNHYSYNTVNNTKNQQNFQQAQPSGDIIIPVSIGNQQLETLVISAIQIENARSGGWTL